MNIIIVILRDPSKLAEDIQSVDNKIRWVLGIQQGVFFNNIKPIVVHKLLCELFILFIVENQSRKQLNRDSNVVFLQILNRFQSAKDDIRFVEFLGNPLEIVVL